MWTQEGWWGFLYSYVNIFLSLFLQDSSNYSRKALPRIRNPILQAWQVKLFPLISTLFSLQICIRDTNTCNISTANATIKWDGNNCECRREWVDLLGDSPIMDWTVRFGCKKWPSGIPTPRELIYQWRHVRDTTWEATLGNLRQFSQHTANPLICLEMPASVSLLPIAGYRLVHHSNIVPSCSQQWVNSR